MYTFDKRKYWVDNLIKIINPVLTNCANDNLKNAMPLYGKAVEKRGQYAYLEALGRTICGIAPWLELSSDGVNEWERSQKEKYAELARRSIANCVDPEANDYMIFDRGTQPLVDAAFLAQGILRAPKELWDKFDHNVRKNILQCMLSTRKIRPWRNNWILFSAMIEVFIMKYGEEEHQYASRAAIDYALSQFEQWYVGDGFYSDGKEFSMDYYNGIVIHPLLMDIVKNVPWVKEEQYFTRSRRYAEIQEKMISPEGFYPIIGRSICYRGGIFHGLTNLILFGGGNKSSYSVSNALTAVLVKLTANPDCFTNDGWLRIGVIGGQPELGEEYITTGSLYMWCTMFLVLGLNNEHDFWKESEEKWSSSRVWSGEKIEADKALHNRENEKDDILSKAIIRNQITGRVDIKNLGSEKNDIKILNVTDTHTTVESPKWFCNNGKGYVLHSRKGLLDICFQCIGEGNLTIYLRAKDVRDKENNRLPIFVNYNSFKLNGQEMLLASKECSHDKPYKFEGKVKDGDSMQVHIEWEPSQHMYFADPDKKEEIKEKTVEKVIEKVVVQKEIVYDDSKCEALRSKLLEQENSYEQVADKCEQLQNSISYRLGYALTNPVRIIRNLFKK